MAGSRRGFLRQAICGLVALAADAASPAEVAEAPTPQETAAMGEVAAAFLKAHSIPGMAVAIARAGELVYEKGFGLADRNRGERVQPSHLFRIASVSKPITSVTVFRLIEQGRLHLDDLVFGPAGVLGNDFGAPPYKAHVGEIRLKHLLTHTAGGWQNDGADPMFRNPRMNHEKLITWTLANVALSNAPGGHYAYSNFGFCVLGRIIEKVTRRPYEQHVVEAVLRPCGISDMRISGDTLAERAKGEVLYYGMGGQNPYGMNIRRMDSHGGWLATASDLVRFTVHIDGFSTSPDILQEATIREMTTPTAAGPRYAKGWSVNNANNWWHGGSLPGTTSIMVRTASGFCWAALANSRESSGDTGGALDRMMWEMVRQVKNWKA